VRSVLSDEKELSVAVVGIALMFIAHERHYDCVVGSPAYDAWLSERTKRLWRL